MAYDLSKLGIKQNIPKVNFTDYCGLLISEPKWGKTTIASMYPNAVIVPFEEGYMATVSNVAENVKTWDDFVSFVNDLEDNRAEIGDSIKTIVFDTVNKAYDKCELFTLKLLSKLDGKKYVRTRDVPHGAFWSERDRQFTLQVDRLLAMGFMPLFITHSELETITPENGQPYEKYSSTMPDRLEKIINPLVSYIMYGERKKIDDGLGNQISKRALVVNSNDMMTAGSRVRLDGDILFDTEEEGMAKFQAEFKKMIQEKLTKAGIKEDIDKLSKKQAKEKMEQVEKYIEIAKSIPAEEMIEKIKAGFAKTTEEVKTKAKEIMKINSIKSFEELESAKLEIIKEVFELLK